MDSDSSLILQLFFLVLLIAVNAFFASSEIAIIQFNDARLQKLADEGNKRARQLCRLTSQPSRFLATIQVGVTLAGFLASAVAASSFTGRSMSLFPAMNDALYQTVSSIVLFVVTLLLSLVTLIFGELVPKRIAMQKGEKLALRFAGVLTGFSAITKPVVSFLALATNGILRLFGINPSEEPEEVTEEEIRLLVDVGEEKGVIDTAEKHMINNIFEFDERIAAEVMTHRTVLAAMPLSSTVDELVAFASEAGFSRIPVYGDDIDSIEGIIYVKDLLPFVGKPLPDDFSLKNILRAPLFVPESNKLSELFDEMTAKHCHLAVIVDEYGGTSGIVTMEDLLEAIVGAIQDEYDVGETEEIEQIGEHVYDIEGTAAIAEVCDQLDIELPEGEYDTIGGLVLDALGRIPNENEHPTVSVAGVEFKVGDVEENRIVSVIVTVKG